MLKRTTILCLSALALLSIGAAAHGSIPARGAPEEPPAGERSPDFLPGLPGVTIPHFATEADLIRDAYRRYELLAARAGAEVRFELSDFRTLYPDDYNDHLMTDVRTYGGDWNLRALMSHVKDDSRGSGSSRSGSGNGPGWSTPSRT